jgi:AcrR family transcriptional regulator
MRSTESNPISRFDAPTLLLTVDKSPKRKRDRAAKQRSLLHAAKGLFATRGYDATTTREIAASAGCAEGLIHRYFNGKAGLFLALIQYRIAQEVSDLNDHVPIASTFQDEFVRLVDWEVERMWEDRDFLRVIIPRAMVDPKVGRVLGRVGKSRRTKAIMERLCHFKECNRLPKEGVEAFARLINVIGFGFGFLRPAIMDQDAAQARSMARVIATVLARSVEKF